MVSEQLHQGTLRVEIKRSHNPQGNTGVRQKRGAENVRSSVPPFTLPDPTLPPLPHENGNTTCADSAGNTGQEYDLPRRWTARQDGRVGV